MLRELWRDESGRAFSMESFPGVEFVELADDGQGPVDLIVTGATRAVRSAACSKFAAVMVEYGSRFSDMVFHDVDDCQKLPGRSEAILN